MSGGEEGPHLPPGAALDPRAALQQVLGLQGRIRRLLFQLRSELDSPAVREIVHHLEETRGTRVGKPLARVRNALQEAVDVADGSLQELSGELDRLVGSEGGGSDRDGLPPGLARFVAERASLPGFDYETSRDPLRGWVVRWRERLDDGSVRAGGLLYEKPHAWIHD